MTTYGKVTKGKMTPVDGGAWLRYDAFGLPLAAHASDITSGPITILWKGSVAAPQLQKFFADIARMAFSKEKVRYRTQVLTGTARDIVESPDAPPLGHLWSEARFVRFECAPAAGSDASAQDPVLIAWAVLDEPQDDTQESIGVYFRREDMPVILPQIEPLVVGTAATPKSIYLTWSERARRTKRALQALSQDLS
jgi:hypothetical protein